MRIFSWSNHYPQILWIVDKQWNAHEPNNL